MELNKLHLDNCINVLNKLDDNSIDLFVQDPPFEVTHHEWDHGFIKLLPTYWDLWLQKGKPNCVYVFKATFPFIIDLINSNRKMFKYEWVWKKNKLTNHPNAKIQPMRCIEYLVVFYDGKITYNPILRHSKYPSKAKTIIKRTSTTYGKGLDNPNYFKEKTEFVSPINLLDIPVEKDAFVSNNGSQNRHPNRTNPELWKYLIKTYSNENDIVFDGFGGSCSIAQACIETNRFFISSEMNEEYYKMGLQHITDSISKMNQIQTVSNLIDF